MLLSSFIYKLSSVLATTTKSNKRHRSSVPRGGWRMSLEGLQEAGKCWLAAACCQYWMCWEFQNTVRVDCKSERVACGTGQCYVRCQVSKRISQYLWFSSAVCDLIIAALSKHNKILTICLRLYTTRAHTRTRSWLFTHTHMHAYWWSAACVRVCVCALCALKRSVSQSWKQLWVKSSGRKNLIRKIWMVIKTCLLQTVSGVIPWLKSLFKRTKMLTNERSSNNTYICNRCSKNTVYNVDLVGVICWKL